MSKRKSTQGKNMIDLSDYLFQAKSLVPNKVVVIELDRDLNAVKGNILILPIDNPGAVCAMSKQQFDVLFTPTKHTTEPDQRDTDTYLESSYSERYLVKSLGAKWDHVKRAWYVPSGLDLIPFQRWLPKAKPVTKALVSVTPPRTGYSISCQCARILSRLAYLSRMANGEPVKTFDLSKTTKDGLLPNDARQSSSRIITLLREGYVSRSTDVANGRICYTHKPTQKGYELLAELADWPWTHRNLKVPDWATTVL